ncbi:gamma-glutamyltransferase family protein [Acetobacter vaccinii]|uniref:Gamma-glutamyltransferase family protein n=1 Tax=Acetobacter vaccinii TaxID=2592655 RepID=A0A5C1YPQ1_9PROT|nr:gamma-glutamyltransferase family protein [Acetobacter vaccinii]QEO17189.1 gamma-glutamyltransferase family protein [Acetobacter vaccinii]
MLHTSHATRGMVTSPHHLASQAGLDILKKGGTALEAVVATAATLSAVYPHMTGLGGDAFWLIAYPDGRTCVIDACGAAAGQASLALYDKAGHTTIPWRGGLAANSMAGAVSGWREALRLSARLQPTLPLQDLLRDATYYAEQGYAVSDSEAALLREKQAELATNPAFMAAYAGVDSLVAHGDIRRNPALGRTLRQLAEQGLDSFYTGPLAQALCADLAESGSPLRLEDFAGHRATLTSPLHTTIRGSTLYNTPPPTQGVASLAILKIFDDLPAEDAESFAHIHGLVEATKKAFLFRNAHVGDPAYMTECAQSFLNDTQQIKQLARAINMHEAMPWPAPSQQGDTTWMGAIDASGVAVSMIQSLYFEFGSGVFLPNTGLIWQNRGSSFQLSETGWNALKPGRKPFHTLNPAMARFEDGRTMVYGTMGGEGQPQTQAAIFSRYARYGTPLQQAVTAPRWLLGRTWGMESVSLKIESNFSPTVIQQLRDAGHTVELVAPFSAMMGHAGAVVRHGNGLLEGASDPRSDGCVAAF